MNPYERYQQQMVTTMTQGDMLIKLYDEVIKQIEIARAAIETKKISEMDAALSKAQKIIHYLQTSLDPRYDISSTLGKLYEFFASQIVMANVKKDVKLLDDISPLILDLRNTFEQCDRQNRAGRTSFTTGDVV